MSTADTAKSTKSGKGGKKVPKSKKVSGKAKGKVVKAKHEEPQIASSFLEPEDDDFEVKVAPVSDTKSKKRKSEEMNMDAEKAPYPHAQVKVVDNQSPPRKRRATRTRSSVVQPQEMPVSNSHDEAEVEIDTHMTDADDMPPPSVSPPKKKRKGGKKRASSTARKACTASTASKASSRAAVPDDEEIDAALEADLNRPLTDEEGDTEPLEVEQTRTRRLTRTKPGAKKATASVASTRRGTRTNSVTVVDAPMTDLCPSIPHVADGEHEPSAREAAEPAPREEHFEPLPKANNARGKVSRKVSKQQQHQEQPQEQQNAEHEEANVLVDEPTQQEVTELAKPKQPRSRPVSRQLLARRTRVSNIPDSEDVIVLASDANSFVLDAQTAQDDSGHKTDAGVVKQGRSKRGSKTAPSGAKKSKAGKKSATTSRNIEDIVVPIPAEREAEVNDDQTNVVVRIAPNSSDNAQHVSIDIEIPKEQPKATKAPTKGTRAKKTALKSKATAPKASQASSPPQRSDAAEARGEPAVSSPPLVHSTTRPALSPQSSDAENQPPSSRLSTLRPPLSVQSLSRSQIMRASLAVTTPTASPSRGNFSKLQTTFPWTAVDLEQIFRGSPSPDKENNPLVLGKASGAAEGTLTSPEKKLNVEQWIQSNAQRGEEKLRNECERLVGRFESQGMKALKTLEGIVAAE